MRAAVLLTRVQCDQGRPACSRCTRLELQCVGAGQQRYKFEVQTARSRESSRKPGGTPHSSEAVVRSPLTIRRYPPSNAQTTLVHAFAHRVTLDTHSDLRYSLTWAYGGYLLDIPRRLGSNAALDSAAVALISSHSRYTSGERKASHEELLRYSDALAALRSTLDDPGQACSTNTLCAVMILMICQVGDSPFLAH